MVLSIGADSILTPPLCLTHSAPAADARHSMSAMLSTAFVFAIFAGYLMPYEAVLFETRDAICGGECVSLYGRGGRLRMEEEPGNDVGCELDSM